MNATTKSAGELQGTEYTLILDSQEMFAIEENCNFSKRERAGITGMIVKLGDGYYKEVWTTTYAAPFMLDAIYTLWYA